MLFRSMLMVLHKNELFLLQYAMGLFDSWSVKDFNIHLSSTTLLPGQMVSGNVVFTVTSEMSFRYISFKVIGREFTHIEVSYDDSTSHYYGKRNFFKVHITPLGMPKWGGDWKGTLAPGTYNFPFAVRLPMDCLPTMMHSCGNNSAAIQYYVKAKIDIPFSTDSDKVAPFNVVTAMPLAQSLTAAPYYSQLARAPRVCCCCCDQGYTNVTFSLEKHLLVFGKDTVLNGHITIDNSASKEATKTIVVTLVRQTTFSAQGRARIAINRLASVSIATHLLPLQQGEKTLPFQLLLNEMALPNYPQLPRCFQGELMTYTYQIRFESNGDLLGQVALLAASAVDESNAALPVQTDMMMGRTVPVGMYPRFLYAPPPGGMPQVPPQKADIGPFPCQPPLAPIPY